MRQERVTRREEQALMEDRVKWERLMIRVERTERKLARKE